MNQETLTKIELLIMDTVNDFAQKATDTAKKILTGIAAEAETYGEAIEALNHSERGIIYSNFHKDEAILIIKRAREILEKEQNSLPLTSRSE